MAKRILVAYFSPTKSTKRVVQAIGEGIAGITGGETSDFDLTLPAARDSWRADTPSLDAYDVLVVGFPVYSGRVPTLFLEEIGHLKGNDIPAIIVATYGNRAIDDALIEATDILSRQGFLVTGLVSFPCEHSFTNRVATGRPNAYDLEIARSLGAQIAEKLMSGSHAPVEVPGNRPYIEFPHRDSRPLFDEDLCVSCMTCALSCPAGAIGEDPGVVDESCIACVACVKNCPAGARALNMEAVGRVIDMLEGNFSAPQEASMILYTQML